MLIIISGASLPSRNQWRRANKHPDRPGQRYRCAPYPLQPQDWRRIKLAHSPNAPAYHSFALLSRYSWRMRNRPCWRGGGPFGRESDHAPASSAGSRASNRLSGSEMNLDRAGLTCFDSHSRIAGPRCPPSGDVDDKKRWPSLAVSRGRLNAASDQFVAPCGSWHSNKVLAPS